MSKPIDYTGKRINNLVVIKKIESVPKKSMWLCLCDCGNTTNVDGGRLSDKGRQTKSCRDCFVKRHTKHGKSFTREYRAWRGMKDRCNNPNIDSYHNYGGRGITYCERWKRFSNFFADMGLCPSENHSLDRSNVNGNYEPKNCRWATLKEQNRNKRVNRYIIIGGVTRCVQEWCEIYNIRYGCFYYRTTHGMDEILALTTPVNKNMSRTYAK